MEAKLEAASIEKARRHLRRHDSTLAQLMRRVGPCRFDSRGDPYRGLIRSVIYQQLAGAAAAAIAAVAGGASDVVEDRPKAFCDRERPAELFVTLYERGQLGRR